MPSRILIVDDEKLIRWSIAERLGRENLLTTEAADGASALEALAREPFDLVLLDLKLPDTDGLTLLKQLQSQVPELPVLMITAHSSVDTAVEAMKLGAHDYLTKPFNLDELVLSVRRAMETTALRRDAGERLREAKSRFGFGQVVGASKKMKEIIALARKVARSEAATVLLRGESGSGKDVIARAIHYESARASAAFMNITCTALPDTLLESELFGHERGAFTDAKNQKKGLFELADGGTLFLDEIGDMSPSLQAKLLRVLEEKKFRRVGGTEDVKIDVRVIAATNRDLEKAIRERTFREDLFYRLNIIPIDLPSLRDRTEDIPALVDHFLSHFSREFKKPFNSVTPEAMARLKSHPWPGNVRELRNALERACLLAGSEIIDENDLLLGRPAPAPAAGGKEAFALPPGGVVLEELEKSLVIQALERAAGNQTKAATLLGISRDQLRYRMEKHGLPPRA
ncbi:MAG TPA: sigma-54 dependent transcriptional regulator [Planctomycetota bacterium]|nr:sigma-54 dependent transcriptional regulator [Planctomycetota bacterium]